jgi:hypothetical protein
MRRIASVVTAAAVGSTILIGFSAQPAQALARCTTATHRHYHAADGYYHTWYWQKTERLADGRHRYTAWMPEHNQTDTATC